MANSSARSYVACVPHVPFLATQARSWNPGLWEAYDARVREFNNFDPELIFAFGGDHYSGMHLKLAPTFVVGQIAEALADCGGSPGKLDIPREISLACASFLIDEGFDIATSHAMQVDHGFSNALANFCGDVGARPVVPIHINSLSDPRPSLKRCRLLGEAVGRFAETLGKRVVFLGSGGLSHQTDFIFPQYDTAPDPETLNYILHGGSVGPLTREAWFKKVDDGMDHLKGEIYEGRLKPYINSAWDRHFLELFAAGDLTAFDGWADKDILAEAGYGGGEVRTWIAAAAAGMVAGTQAPVVDYYSDETFLAVGAAVAHAQVAV
jgi:2,3-dihydroxyphenylpropionate 1,2-dioxygenase